ncbi:hypothetical protein TNCV_2532291 [Trichonephila clavipes]|nr:hypothetical protein TNCV_2532291 [Trichonephila clavipes]
MGSRHHIDDFCVGIIGKIEEGRKITDVAREFDIAHSVVSRLWKSFKTIGMCSRRWHSGDGVLEVRRLQKTDISSISKRTGAAQLSSLSSDCRRQLIWREITAYRPENIQENGRTRLSCRFSSPSSSCGRTGTMTGQRYIDEFYFLMFVFSVVLSVINCFLDDNATCHRTLAVQDCLDSEGIQRSVRPAGVLNLNPIESVRDAFGEANCWSKLSSDKQEHCFM